MKTHRDWFARHALGLWFLAIAALGVMRFWMKWREAGAAALPAGDWLWLAGGGICAAIGCLTLIRTSRS